MDAQEQLRLTNYYAELTDEALDKAYCAGPESYREGIWHIIETEFRRRGLLTDEVAGNGFLREMEDLQANNEVVIALSKGKIIGLLAISCVFIAFGLWMASLDPAEIAAQQPHLRFRNPLLVHAVGRAALIGAGLIALFGIRKLFDSRTGLILNGQGIVDNSSAVAAGLIPWPDISGFDVYTAKRQRLLVIKLTDPEKYIARGNRLQQALNRINHKMRGSPIAITSIMLRVSFDDMLKLCRDFQQRYGTVAAQQRAPADVARPAGSRRGGARALGDHRVETSSPGKKPLLFAYSSLLPLVWFGFGFLISSIFPEQRAGAVGTALVIVAAVMLLSWLFVRNHHRNFSRSERWRLIGYCAIWALALESMGLTYAAYAGLVDPSHIGAIAFSVVFAIVLDTLMIWGAFNYASRRFIDSYLQKHESKVA